MRTLASGVQLIVPVSERDHIKGPPSAPLTLVEYGDYECPHCGQAFHVLNAIESYLGRKLRMVYRHFPLSVAHPHARLAAEAAEAAAAQGKFWEMHTRLYEHQVMLARPALVRHAAAIGLDMDRFSQELTQHVYADRIFADFMGGVRSGVNGTPTFFINGTRHDGPYDFKSLLYAFEEVGQLSTEPHAPRMPVS